MNDSPGTVNSVTYGIAPLTASGHMQTDAAGGAFYIYDKLCVFSL